MSLSIKDVEHVANLAKLSFNEEEKADFSKKFSSIVDYMKMLQEIDLKKVEPTYHILPLKNVFREDEIEPSMEREKVLMNAPDQKHGCFQVPKVVD